MAIVVIVWLFYLPFLSSDTYAFEYDDIIKMFEKDSGRSNPVEMTERLKTVISQTTGMEFKNNIEIEFESRGVLKKKMFDQTLGKLYGNVEDGIAGEEFLLKRFHLLSQEKDYYETILDTMLLGVYGMYLPEKKKILIMKGINHASMSNTLLHELIHASQDSYMDLEAIHNENYKNQDSYLAASALVEGQDGVIGILIRAKRNLQDRTLDEILEKILTNLEENISSSGNTEYSEEAELNEFSSRLKYFPYTYGLVFSLKLYMDQDEENFIKMFEKMPISTEQILHFDKYKKDEMPKETVLEKQENIFQDEAQELYTSTLGEYFINSLFNTILNNDKKLNRKASEGWGGDCIRIFRSGKNIFLIWDTLWDTQNDADEFLERYAAFVKKRLNTNALMQENGFDITYPDKEPNLFVKKIDERIVIIEGEANNEIIKNITQKLSIPVSHEALTDEPNK